jgi:hypothetical protein
MRSISDEHEVRDYTGLDPSESNNPTLNMALLMLIH